MTKLEYLKYEIDQSLSESNLIPEQIFQKKNYIYNVFNLLHQQEKPDSELFKIQFFHKKFYIFFTDKKEKVESGEFHIEKISVKNSIEINNEFYSTKGEKERYLYSNFLKEKNFEEYSLNELKEQFLIKTQNNSVDYFSVIITNDAEFLNESSFAINIDEFLKICGFDYNQQNIRFDINNFNKAGWQVLSYFLKILNENILSANEKYVDDGISIKDYDGYGRDYYDSFITYLGWEENRNFEFMKSYSILKNKKFDNNGFLRLTNEKEETILYFFDYLKYEMFDIFSDINRWEKSSKGFKYYHGFRIYVKNEEDFQSLFDGNKFRKFDIEINIDHSYYIEFFIKPLNYWITKTDYNELNEYCKDNNFLKYIIFK